MPPDALVEGKLSRVSQATLLDLGALYDHAVATNDALKSSLSARSRTGYALKTLLADEKTGRAALELASVICQTSAAPLVLQIPSPMLWLALTHQLSGAGTVAGLSVGHAENAAMYIAGWLRRLSMLPVSILLLDKGGRGQANCRWWTARPTPRSPTSPTTIAGRSHGARTTG